MADQNPKTGFHLFFFQSNPNDNKGSIIELNLKLSCLNKKKFRSISQPFSALNDSLTKLGDLDPISHILIK